MWAANRRAKTTMKTMTTTKKLTRTRPLLRVRRRGEAGQSAIIAVIVLFLLLFLGAIFIALISNNLKNTQRAATTSASGRYGEAGINYLDQQLTNSPEGADWRPTPDNEAATLSGQDPDYFWLKPITFNPATGQYEGGFTRVNFGGPTPGQSNLGGRALVRVTYRPDPNPQPATGGTAGKAINKYIKIESIGRSGQVDANDPTTFGNSDSVGQRVELVAFKAIGVNEYVRQAYNKDNKPATATFGAPFPVLDRGQPRDIETIIEGPVHFNTNLAFYGVNRFRLVPERNDAIEVAGTITLNGVNPAATTLTNTDPTRVFVNTTPAAQDTGNLFPSASANFTTTFPHDPANGAATGGLVRDNPRGNETQNLAQTDTANRNLRTVPRTTPPLIDAQTGPNGATRYRTLTRDSAPLNPAYAAANPVDANIQGSAGALGWGQGLYINNPANVQNPSETLLGGLSPRTNWLNPGTIYWNKGDFEYVPPAVTIVLTPRSIIMQRASDDTAGGQRGSYFRQPNNAGVFRAGQRLAAARVIRYTAVGNQPPTAGVPTGTLTFEGYPADPPGALDPGETATTHASSYKGDFVIYAEGNIRIRGVVGGLDPETGAYFKRHLTVVSGNGTIYVDGNLLRDNISPADNSAGASDVRGQSSIALLAKKYVAVNTTQFLSPADQNFESETQGQTDPPFAIRMRPVPGGLKQFDFRLNIGPEDALGTTPRYVTGANNVLPLSLFVRHAPADKNGTALNLFVNGTATGTPNLYNFGAGAGTINPVSLNPVSLVLSNDSDAVVHVYDRFDLTNDAANNKLLLGANVQAPYASAPPIVGGDNFMALNLDESSGNARVDYLLTRVGVAPLDIRIEALMYAQEGSFFIIPGPWFNPNPNDTFDQYNTNQRRAEESAITAGVNRQRVNHFYPFYKEPMDIRITFFGAISENLPAEIGDQGAWMEKWGWVPNTYGSTGLTAAQNYPAPPPTAQTVHGPNGGLNFVPGTGLQGGNGTGGSGIVYQFDDRMVQPYVYDYTAKAFTSTPLRPNPNFATLAPNLREPLPVTPRLPVAPGLLYYGQNTNLPR